MSEKAFSNLPTISIETIAGTIHRIRGKTVMLDEDLARLYGVETKYLIRQIKRHRERFPEDFMLQLTQQEFLRCHFGTSKRGGRRYLPFAFTEQGVAPCFQAFFAAGRPSW